MKKKQLLAVAGISALAGVTLASCGGNNPYEVDGWETQDVEVKCDFKLAPADENYTTDGGNLNVYVVYNGNLGITYRGDSEYYNYVNKTTYTKGDLLPTWETFQTKTKTKINDVAEYGTAKDDDVYKAVKAKEYGKETGGIDLFYNTTGNIEKMGAAGEAIDLVPYIDGGQMPNFKKWLDQNPTIKKQITKNGKIYYTPYADGYNDIEKMFLMDAQLVSTVLDTNDFSKFDTKTTNGGANPDANVVQSASYKAFIAQGKNYQDADIAKGFSYVTEDGKAGNLKLKQTNYNIIEKQNELLTAGCTGQQLAEQFHNYLIDVYGDLMGSVYKRYSDIFVSPQAVYNADDLIALMRVVKANPGLITGVYTNEVETLFPRGQAANRVDNMLMFASIWGVQGLAGEKDRLFFGADGKLHSAATTAASYEALDLLSAVYDEGLILDNFWVAPASGASGTAYLDKYWKKTKDGATYGLMMYDYSAANCAANDVYNGVGTDPDTRKLQVSQTGMRPVLNPLTYWANESFDVNQALTGTTGKTLMRHTEDNRALKSNSWCIPKNAKNIDGAVRLMDYLYSEMGLNIQDFGPEEYWAKPAVGDFVEGVEVTEENIATLVDTTKSYVSDTYSKGEFCPIMSVEMKAMYAEVAGSKDFWTYSREALGSTHGIGHIRQKGLDTQITNAYAQGGLSGLKNAIALNVVSLSLVDKVPGSYTWETSVPTAGYPSLSDDIKNSYEALTDFWSATHYADTATGWVAIVAAKAGTVAATSTDTIGTATNTKEYSYKKVHDQIATMISTYLYEYSKAQGNDLIPSYAKPAA